MASLSPTESRLLDRRNAVPLLLSSFPVPPSYIPPTPMSSTFHSPLPSPNPPLSLPPSSPLPPVPGPSPITEHETLMFISATRSRRASKLSLASTSGSAYSCRDSIATLASITSSSAPPLSPIMTHADIPSRPLRSFPSSSSLSHSASRFAAEKSPMFEPRICEEGSDTADLAHISLPYLSPMPSTAPSSTDLAHISIPDLSPMPSSSASSSMGFSDTDEDVLDLGIGSSLSRRPLRVHRAPGTNDSISSIELRDLPALQEEETDFGPVPPIPSNRSSLTKTHPQLRPQPITFFPRPPTIVRNKDLPPLPLEDEDPATPTSAESSQTTPTPMATTSRSGASSPDIATIIATTPKPRRRQSSPFSGRSKSRSRPGSTRRSTKRGSGDVVVPVPSLNRVRSGGRRSESGRARRSSFDDEEEEDYGQVLDGTGTQIDWRMLDAEVEARLERELEGVGSDEDALSDGSDSSIDMHTSLPNLMLRDGMLSPYSKLLGASRAATPLDRHMSLVSNADSIMTKTGIYKDERNTTKRRVRHRDGKLLRAGMGLTTGLGWSDSEDEDAPSPLTRRVSSMVLSRRTSASSLASHARPHPLARSVSDTLTSASASLALHQARMKETRPSLPPTAWAGASASSASSPRTSSTASSVFSHSGRRTSDTTVGHSLGDIKEQDAEREDRERDELGAMTPSSASSSSLPMPLTPVGDDEMGAWAHVRDKQLFSTARRVPSRMSTKSSMPFPRERTTSSSSHGSHKAPRPGVPAASSPTIRAAPRTPSARTSSVPRPLRLTQSSVLLDRQSQSGIRAPTVSRSTSASSNVPKTPRARTASGSRIAAPPSTVPHVAVSRLATPSAVSRLPPPTRPAVVTAAAERKPRTGTGMTYRTSNPRPSMMRQPSSSLLRMSASSGTRI